MHHAFENVEKQSLRLVLFWDVEHLDSRRSTIQTYMPCISHVQIRRFLTSKCFLELQILFTIQWKNDKNIDRYNEWY